MMCIALWKKMYINNMYCARFILAHVRQAQAQVYCKRRVLPVRQLKIYSNLRQYSVAHNEEESEKIIDEICNGDPDLEKKLRILMIQVEVMRQDGRRAPSVLQARHWKHLMDLASQNQRSSYLIYLFKTEKAKENEKARKQERKKQFAETAPEEQKEFPDDLLYVIKHQSLFLRIRDNSINTFDNYRTLQSMLYGQSLIVDCSYEKHMVYKELMSAAKQMTLVFGDNRLHRDPFNIHMCNVNLEGKFMEQLRRNIPLIDEPWFPMNIHTESYLDLFPKEKLVYLTPHCREELTRYDHDAVYIVGCMVDKSNNEPLSLAKAKREGLRMAKLPLDRYLQWAPCSKKNLNINHMVPILQDLRTTGDWEFALRHIPRRKLIETKIMAIQKKLKNPMSKEVIILKNLHRPSILMMKDKRMKSIKSSYDENI